MSERFRRPYSDDIVTATISANSDESGVIDLGAYEIVAIEFPDAFTSEKIRFIGSPNNDTYKELYNVSGERLEIVACPGGIVINFPADFISMHHVKIKTSSQESAERTIKLITRGLP
jgi:hypothetical protein